MFAPAKIAASPPERLDAVDEGHGRTARPFRPHQDPSLVVFLQLAELEWERLWFLWATFGWISCRRGDAWRGCRSILRLSGDAGVMKSTGTGRQLKDDVCFLVLFSTFLPLLSLRVGVVTDDTVSAASRRPCRWQEDGDAVETTRVHLSGKGHRL